MLERRIETATSKAVDAFTTYVISINKEGKVVSRNRIQHKLIYNKAQTRKAIEAHLRMVNTWSRSIDILGMPRPKNLDKLYIKLSLTDDPRRFRLGTVKPANVDYSIEDAIATKHHLLILGDPGCGKTTTQKKIARDLLSTRDNTKTGYLPIVIRLRDLKPGTGLLDRIKQIFEVRFAEQEVRLGRNDYKEKGHEFPQLRSLCTFLDEMRILLLLDGYDELNPDLKPAVLNDIDILGLRLVSSRVIMTSRSADFVRKPEEFLLFEIQGLSDEQIESFVKLWFGSTTHRKRTASQFLEILAATPYKDLATRPLTLANLCLVFEKYGSLPELPLSVYRKTINLLLEEWDAERGIHRRSRYSMFDQHRKMDFLAAFAYYLVVDRNSALSFTPQDFIRIYSRINKRFGLPDDEAAATALEIESHTGLIIKSSYETYEFSHKSLQEFLVAEHLVRLRDVPSAVVLLRSCPNELAISVAISSDPTDWLCGCFRDKTGRVKPKPEWILPFLYRISLERPTFEVTAELGATFLWIASRCGELIADARLKQFFEMEVVTASIERFLTHCIPVEDPRVPEAEIALRLASKFPAKYPIPMELRLSRSILNHEEISRVFQRALSV
jgi:DNA polymerase III delta prime subunit